MNVTCLNEACIKHRQPIPLESLEGSLSCSSCHDTLSVVTQAPNSTEDARLYPTPIAIAIQRLKYATTPEERSRALVEAITQLGKYLSLIGASDYLRGEQNDPKLIELLTTKLARPQVSTWFEMINLQTKDERSFLPQLVEFWIQVTKPLPENKVTTSSITLLDEHGVERPIRPLSPIEFMLNFRNNWAHKTSMMRTQLNGYATEAEQVFYHVLSQLDWLWRYTLVARVEESRVTKTIPLRGTNVSLEYSHQSEINIVLQSPELDRELLLLPFYVTAPDVKQGTGFSTTLTYSSELVVLEDIQKRHLLYTSPETGNPYAFESYKPLWTELIERKSRTLVNYVDQTGANYETLYERAKQSLDKDLNDAGIDHLAPEMYCPRSEQEEQLKEWIRSDQPLCILTGEGGMGKTTLLSNVARKWTDEGHAIIWFSALHTPHSHLEGMIQQRLNLMPEVSIPLIQSVLEQHSVSLVIIIDGLNESDQIDDYLDLVTSALELSNPCKILMSTRHAPENERLIAQRALVFDPTAHTSGQLTRSPSLPEIRLNPLSYAELSELWSVLSQSTKRTLYGHTIAYKPKFDFATLSKAHEDVQLLLQSPLQLSLFLMVFNKSDLPKNLGLDSVYTRYLKFLKKWGDAYALLTRIAQVMWDLKTRLISISELFVMLQNEGREADYLQSDGPLAQLIQLQILAFTTSQGDSSITPRIDGLIEHLIAQALLQEHKLDPTAALRKPNRIHPLGEAIFETLVRLLCERRFTHNRPDHLRQLLEVAKETEWTPVQVGYSLAHHFGNHPVKLCDEEISLLSESFTLSDFEYLYHCSERLRDYSDPHKEVALKLSLMLRDHFEGQLEPRQRYDLADEITNQYMYLERWQDGAYQAEITLSYVESLHEEPEHNELLARALNQVAYSCWHLSEIERGLLACDRAKELYKLEPERFKVQPKLTCYWEFSLAIAGQDFERAERVYEEIERFGHDRDLSLAMNDLGNMWLQLNHPERAYEYFQKAYHQICMQDGPDEALLPRLNLAYCDYHLGNHKKSFEDINEVYDYVMADKVSPHHLKILACIYLGEVGSFQQRNKTQQVDNKYQEAIFNALALSEGVGDRLEVFSIITALIHIEDLLSNEDIDNLLTRLTNLQLIPYQFVICEKFKAFRALSDGRYDQAIEYVENIFAVGGVTKEQLRDPNESATETRWNCVLIGPLDTLPILYCWAEARAYLEGCNDDVLSIFDELLKSDPQEAFPVYQTIIRAELSGILVGEERYRLSIFHAQIAQQEAKLFGNMAYFPYVLATQSLITSYGQLNEIAQLQKCWNDYVKGCTQMGVSPESDLQSLYLGYIKL